MDYNTFKESIPVPRSRIFVLKDGTFVVQWEENRVQCLLTGRYYPFSSDVFGADISDYELNQLKNSNVVLDYDSELVQLAPDLNRTAQRSSRSFYLNTTLHKTRMADVQTALQEAGLSENFSVRIHDIFVVIRGKAGKPFTTFDDAERVRELLADRMPKLLCDMVVAFVEVGTSSR